MSILGIGKDAVQDSIVDLFAVFDSKALLFAYPFPAMTPGVAIRQFTEFVNNPNHAFGKHPEDYILFKVARWNETKGIYLNLNAPENLGVGSGYVKVQQ